MPRIRGWFKEDAYSTFVGEGKRWSLRCFIIAKSTPRAFGFWVLTESRSGLILHVLKYGYCQNCLLMSIFSDTNEMLIVGKTWEDDILMHFSYINSLMWPISPTLHILKIDCHEPFILCFLGFWSVLDGSFTTKDTNPISPAYTEVSSKDCGCSWNFCHIPKFQLKIFSSL